MGTRNTHPSNCPDHKQAAADRKAHAAAAQQREARYQALAHAVWFEWYAPRARPLLPKRNRAS